MQTQRLTFDGATGAKLSARLELPVDEQPFAYAIFAHCFTCSKNYKAVVNISRALAQAHIGVLRFDFTGLGESEGDFSDTTFSTDVDDLVAAAEFLGREYQAPAIMIGHSLGGAAVLHAARKVPSCKAVVTINSPAEPKQLQRHLTRSIEEIEKCGEAEVQLAGRPFTIKKAFLDDLNQQNMAEVLGNLGRALLVFQSPDDPVVGSDNATRLFETAKPPKNFVALPGADHLLSSPEDSEYVGAAIAAWAARYLDKPKEPEKEGGSHHGDVFVRTGQARYPTEIFARGHALVADEPERVGGTDTGPTPFGLLMAALGACTTITLRMYADRKEWPLQEIGVQLNHRKLKPADAPKSDAGLPITDEIKQELNLVGPLDEEQRARLLDIAHRCPVHKAIDAGVLMPMELRESE